MPSDLADLQLAAEMAVISTVKSAELVGMSSDTSKLEDFQRKLEDQNDRVSIVKKVLSATPPSELDIHTATQMDGYLRRSEVDLPVDALGDVQGIECLGVSLMPKDYIENRLAGCENFLGDFYRKAKEISTLIGIGFRDSYLVFTQSVDSLNDQVDLLEKHLGSSSFKAGTDTILLGTRLYNLFKVNGKVSEDWVPSVTKLSTTISALSSNYYLANQTALNNVLSYFGGFDGVGQEEGVERLLLLPKSIVSVRFKECSYPCKEYTTNTVIAKQSVELMGGAYFVDQRLEKVNTNPTTVDQVESYVQGYVDFDSVGFENSSGVEYPRSGMEIKTLSSDTIKAVIKLLRDILKAWRKSSEGIERYKINDSDYTDIVKAIYESSMSDELKSTVQHAFSAIVRKNQIELLTTRASVNNYLVLIFNGLIEISNTSISANSTH